MQKNIYYNSDFIFSVTPSGVGVYNKSLNKLGNIEINNVSCVYANDSFVYIATTTSGILLHSISSISGSIFNDIMVYKQYPDILSNYVNYIHGASDYLLITTISGIDQYTISTNNRIYNASSQEISKCFQTTSGRFYYIGCQIDENAYNYGIYKSRIDFTRRTTFPDYQFKIVLTSSNFDYSKVTSDGRDILFFDVSGNLLYFFLESWVYGGTSVFWVKITDVGTDYINIVYGKQSTISQSDALATFDIFDHFDYPLATVTGTNLFLPIYGNITASGTPQVELLYDGNLSIDYSSGFPLSGDYVQIEFFAPKTIRKLEIWQNSYSVGNDVYLYGSNTGEFLGEEDRLFYRTTALSTAASFMFFITDAYTYYRLVRGAGNTAWRLTEIRMYEVDYLDILTVSGTPWVYSSNSMKFAVNTDSILTCNNSNNDYIRTDFVIDPPVVIEQRVRLIYSVAGNAGYSNLLEPNTDGVIWYPAGASPTFKINFNGDTVVNYYKPQTAMTSDWSIFSTTISYSSISVDISRSTLSFSKLWNLSPNGTSNRALQIFCSGPESEVEIDWIRVRKYDSYIPEVKTISSAILLGRTYKLNVMYTAVNWTDATVEYSYPVAEGVIINDIFITENTSTYSTNNGVIFLATSEGVMVIEERRGDETNSRIKYCKARGF